MPQTVSINNNFFLPKLEKIKNVLPQRKTEEVSIIDSFIKNTAETTPILLGTTAAVSFVKSKSQKISFDKIMKKEVKTRFLPLLFIISSAATAFENYIKSEEYDINKSEK